MSSPQDRARRAAALVHQRLAKATQAAVATAMGSSPATISRLKDEKLDEVMLLLAHLGLRVVDADAKIVDADAYAFLTKSHAKVMRLAPEIVFEQNEDC